jgi:hypothetical protein
MINKMGSLSLFLFCNFGASNIEASENCNLVRSKKIFPGYITGLGEGTSYSDAKIDALADLLKIFGTDISAKTTVTESLQGGSLHSEHVSSLSQESVGAEVLETCEAAGSNYRIIMGVRKSLLSDLLDSRARARVSMAKNADMTKYQIKLAQKAEAKDRESWLVLGLPLKDFPTATFQAPKKTSGPFSIKVDDDIARVTLPLLLLRLDREGIEISPSGDEVSWSCLVASGTAVGDVIRFEVNCIVGQDLLPQITAKGMARPSEKDQQAVRLVSKKLMDQTFTH